MQVLAYVTLLAVTVDLTMWDCNCGILNDLNAVKPCWNHVPARTIGSMPEPTWLVVAVKKLPCGKTLTQNSPFYCEKTSGGYHFQNSIWPPWLTNEHDLTKCSTVLRRTGLHEEVTVSDSLHTASWQCKCNWTCVECLVVSSTPQKKHTSRKPKQLCPTFFVSKLQIFNWERCRITQPRTEIWIIWQCSLVLGFASHKKKSYYLLSAWKFHA